MNYHAHIYFDEQQLPLAQHLLLLIKEHWAFETERLVTKKVGPHARPMIEAHFPHSHKHTVLRWLEENRTGLSVLIHPDTGDDYADHDQGRIIWLGEELPIDFSFFDLVANRPELSLH